MATAVLTFTKNAVGRQPYGSRWKVHGYLASDDGDYAAGGLAVTAATFGLSRLDDVEIYGVAADGAGTAPATAAALFESAYYDSTTKKIQLGTSAADGDPLDEGNTATLSGYTIRCAAIGV